MNQKYLRGEVVNTGEQYVFLATPENIAAFIRKYSNSSRVTVITVNRPWKFLTASQGKVEVCPDTEYLTEKLQPALTRIADTPAQEITLETVPLESATKAPCGVPDWNYMHWAGYSDRKFQMIMDRSGLLYFSDGRCDYTVEVVVQTYQQNNNLAVSLVPWRRFTPGEEIWLTANLKGQRQPDHACLDIRQCTPEVMNWLASKNIATPTGKCEVSGCFVYPEFAFNPERLRELDPDGYERHLKCRAEKPKRKDRDTSR